MTTRLAATKLMPRPPARVDIKNSLRCSNWLSEKERKLKGKWLKPCSRIVVGIEVVARNITIFDAGRTI